MAQETRSTGRVRWFNDMKGYGFIEPEDGGSDLFVHQSSIKSDGYRTLSEGAIVEFTFAVGDDNKPKAIDVTGPNGSPIQDPRRDNSFSGSGSWRSGSFGGGWKRDNGGDSFGYSGGAAGGGCYQCGRQGHLARDCPESSSGRGGGVGGGGGSCYNCGQPGHFARECRGVGSGSGGGGACYSCGGFGHMARDCRQAVAASTGGGFGGRFGGGGGGCYNCGDPGHFARECSNRS